MALKKEVPEFDVDDAVLLMEPSAETDSITEISRVGSVGTKSKTATVKQHKFIDYTRALDATQLYLNEIGFSPLLTPEQEVHFARLAQKGDPAGRKRMIESNLRLVVKIARRYVNRGLSLLDLVEELNLYLRAARELTQKLDHEPSPEEIANLLEKPVAEVKRMLGLNERVTSVDVSLGPDTDKTLLDTLTDDRPSDPCELLLDDDLSESIDQWLSDLTEKQREVVIRRFGLRGHESCTLEEVGQEIGLTRERVRQIQVEALKRLREILERNGLSSESLFR